MALENEKQSKRCFELSALGMIYDGNSYIGNLKNNQDFNVHHTEISFNTDEEWSKIITGLKNELMRRNSTCK
jgi:hypothetical protein